MVRERAGVALIPPVVGGCEYSLAWEVRWFGPGHRGAGPLTPAIAAITGEAVDAASVRPALDDRADRYLPVHPIVPALQAATVGVKLRGDRRFEVKWCDDGRLSDGGIRLERWHKVSTPIVGEAGIAAHLDRSGPTILVEKTVLSVQFLAGPDGWRLAADRRRPGDVTLQVADITVGGHRLWTVAVDVRTDPADLEALLEPIGPVVDGSDRICSYPALLDERPG